MDYTTAVAQVRLLIADVATDETKRVLTDAHVGGFLTLQGAAPEDGAQSWQVRRAAADALTTIAASETLIGKYVRTADGLTTDGTKVGAELRAQADRQLAIADREEADHDAADGAFGVLEFQPYPRGR
ncbi:hypothetical protein Xcel_0534 [Xylanimonas cellulosilytica DSM 15894]|uniref:Uncharacterized protein n=1 Tax=Xylanimonas cellulosilytica (strain DSM 15894 / JCM 12276 / CECT 5975 / KCTC 9989 / LMG 20990 / NBRC 107835 / XIL07) TaxID=446471 RepID=D1BW70_XYLCX|nr:hypothetical protein [Xylanimonas cellulosilytica]ACZ29573.1 hypothetical protein Xcel_0534 [Xylanimonas cellulosilytica DSM 15894]